ncbi:SUMF1/EgtB/PvdO family nonheme iron enzyme [Azonexus sp.]|uniref:SUMF1/EgtB/PvdO family nonheme iron enzyme n=1 Tax=Azonexus sp. TaxID=1872668 RepID=UPI0035AFAE8A
MKRVTGFIAGLTIALACTNAQAFTAVALSNSTSRVGVSMNAPSKEAAMSAAVENCKAHGGGSDCRVIELTEKRGYFAIFMSCDNGCSIALETGSASKEQARADAKRVCERNTGNACQLLTEWEERGYQAPATAAAAPPTPLVQAAPVAYKPAVQLDDNSRKKEKRTRGGLFLLGDATPGKVYKDCKSCPEMVNLPAGSFAMGQYPANVNYKANPGHRVSLPPFAIGRTEVTVAQYAAFVQETGRPEPSVGCEADIDLQKVALVKSWREPGYPVSGNHPVSCVTWEDANAYVKWLSYKFKRQYRLPSEAEWEYAARAGTTGLYPWGGDQDQACEYANVGDVTAQAIKKFNMDGRFKCNDGQVFPTPVASYRPNAFGLYDMSGNMSEMTADCFHPTFAGAPVDGSARNDPPGCERRVVRGENWALLAANLTLRRPADADVSFSKPGGTIIRSVTRGFRVALNLDPDVMARVEAEQLKELMPARRPTTAEENFLEEYRRNANNRCFATGDQKACSEDRYLGLEPGR